MMVWTRAPIGLFEQLTSGHCLIIAGYQPTSLVCCCLKLLLFSMSYQSQKLCPFPNQLAVNKTTKLLIQLARIKVYTPMLYHNLQIKCDSNTVKPRIQIKYQQLQLTMSISMATGKDKLPMEFKTQETSPLKRENNGSTSCTFFNNFFVSRLSN